MEKKKKKISEIKSQSLCLSLVPLRNFVCELIAFVLYECFGQCSCDCWDGNFRGHHNRGGYKAFYFNYEFETLYSAIVFAIGICLFKDYVQRLCTLSMKRAIRTPCFIGTIALIQPIWYGSWVIVNYYNEFIYKSTSHSGYFAGMYRAQIFFLLTEVIVAFIFALNMDSTRIVHEESMFLALFFSIMHILLAVREKVLWGLIWPGESNVGRDVLFVSTDLISILCSSIILWFGSGCSYPWWNICGGLRSQFQYRSLPFQESQRPIRSEPWFRPAVVACVLIVCYFLFLRFEPPERVV